MESCAPPDPKPPDISEASSPGPIGSERSLVTTPKNAMNGPNKTLAQLTTQAQKTELPTTSSPNEDAPRHQGVETPGGINVNQRVLLCSNVDLSLDYELIYEVMKRFGIVERIKMKIAAGERSFDCYTTFSNSSSANKACNELRGHSLNGSILKTKLFNYNNLNEEVYDFVPKATDRSGKIIRARNQPTFTWHVATYREGRQNLLRATESIQSKVGNIPPENFTVYGKNLLIKAGNSTQASLLSNFKPSESGNIQSITPHKTFNTLKGVVFSKDLYDFSEDEILERCPPSVYRVQKLRGINNTILLTFSSSYVPDHILINHVRIKVKKSRANPKQCHNCFEYGHIASDCNNDKRCYVCSSEHEEWDDICSLDRHCYHCKGSHSPNSRECPRRQFEQEIMEVANNQHISIGSAKRQVMGANKRGESTYASIIKQMKAPVNVRGPIQSKQGKSSNPQSATGSPAPINDDTKNQAEDNSSSAEMNFDCLPDLSAPNESKDACPGLASSNTPNDTNTINVELNSSAMPKKTQIDKDGFSMPSSKKRIRPASPKNKSHEIKTSNSFSILGDTPVVKKQAVSKELKYEKSTSNPKGYQYEEQACRPKVHRSSSHDSMENQCVSKKRILEPTKRTDSTIPGHSLNQCEYKEQACCPKVHRSSSHDSMENQSVSEKRTLDSTKRTETTIPGHSSHQKCEGNDSRKYRPSNNTIHSTKCGSSQSQNAKIGKRNNIFK